MSNTIIAGAVLIGWLFTVAAMLWASRYLSRRKADCEVAYEGYHPLGPVYQQRRRKLIVCSNCRCAEEVDEWDRDTVGDWGEKILCSECKVERSS